MLSSVLAALTCTAIPVSDPLSITAQMPAGQPAVEVGAHLTATTFRCRNFSASNYLLVFGKSGTAQILTVPLPGGSEVAYGFTPEEFSGTSFEVVSAASATDLATSGAMPLALASSSSDGSLWFVRGTVGLVTWQQTGCEVVRVTPLPSLLPSSVPASGPDDECAAAAQAPIAVPTSTVPAGGVPPPPSPM